jgi:Mg2+ and Co2+ transporter CorA
MFPFQETFLRSSSWIRTKTSLHTTKIKLDAVIKDLEHEGEQLLAKLTVICLKLFEYLYNRRNHAILWIERCLSIYRRIKHKIKYRVENRIDKIRDRIEAVSDTCHYIFYRRADIVTQKISTLEENIEKLTRRVSKVNQNTKKITRRISLFNDKLKEKLRRHETKRENLKKYHEYWQNVTKPSNKDEFNRRLDILKKHLVQLRRVINKRVGHHFLNVFKIMVRAITDPLREWKNRFFK